MLEYLIHSEVIGDTGVLFDPYDNASIADAMGRLLKDADLLENCRKRGLVRAREYSWGKTADQTLKVLNEAAEARS